MDQGMRQQAVILLFVVNFEGVELEPAYLLFVVKSQDGNQGDDDDQHYGDGCHDLKM